MIREPGLDYMELELQIHRQQIHGVFRVPPLSEAWRYRSQASSGSQRVLYGVCAGRLIAAAQMAFPSSNGRKAVMGLFYNFLSTGVPLPLLDRLARMMCFRFPTLLVSLETPLLQGFRHSRDRARRILSVWDSQLSAAVPTDPRTPALLNR